MHHAIILAAGEGKRLKSKENKMLISAGGHPLIYYSVMAFNDHPDIDSITVVCSKSNKSQIEEIIKLYRFSKVKQALIGSSTRQRSLEKGLQAIEKIAKKDDIIAVCGKGHEKSMNFNGIEMPWSDKEKILKIIKKL